MRQNYWTTRVSRRRFVRATGVGSVGAAALAIGVACGDDDDDDEQATSPTSSGSPAATQGTTTATESAVAGPPRGGSISTAASQDPVSLDLHHEQNVWHQLGVVYSKVLKQVKGGVAPDLATNMPETPDDRTIVVKLREGVRFHDIEPVNGRELTAEDVKYSYERIATDQPEYQSRRFITSIESIEATDAHTLTLTLKEPFAPLVNYLGYPTMVIVAREAVELTGDLRQGPLIGTGPFQSTNIQPGVRYDATRFANYFEEGKPYLDEFSVRVIPERGTVVAQFRSGDLSYLPDATPDELDQVRSSVPDVGSERGLRNRLRTAMNTQSGIFADPRIRQAVHLATDRPEMIDLMWGGEGEMYSVLPSFYPGVLTEQDLIGRPGFRENKDEDIAEARALLEAAGYGDGLDVPNYLSLQLSVVPDAVTIHAEQLNRAGFNVTLQPIAYADWTERMLAHDFEIAGGVTSMRLDPDDHLFTEYHSAGPRNDPDLQDPQVDELIAQQRRIFDESERSNIWRELDEMMLDVVPYVPFFVTSLNVIWQPGIQGLTADGGRMNYFGHVLADVYAE